MDEPSIAVFYLSILLYPSETVYLFQSDPTRSVVVIWVKIFKTEKNIEFFFHHLYGF